MHWVIIETGSNQRYIFATDKQRLQVAASAMVWQLGFEWIRQAITDVGLTYTTHRAELVSSPDHVLHVVEASGRAVLIVHTPGQGRSIISNVTARALAEHSGLDVWGCVGPAIRDDLSDAHQLFVETDVLLRDQRTRRLPPATRYPNLPFHEQCAYTGRPTVRRAREVGGVADADPQSRSDVIDYLFTASTRARARMLDRLEVGIDRSDRETIRDVTVRLTDLTSTGLKDNGWIGVLHADGNGIGRIFANLRRVYPGSKFVEKQRELSAALESLTWKALQDSISGRDAATGARSAWAEPDARKVYRNSVLPIIVGGDDVSLAASGRIAFDLAVLLMKNFGHYATNSELGAPFTEALTQVKRVLSELDEPVEDIPDTLSLAVGLVFTKPNHPFVHSISLAEELTSEAKRQSGRRYAALDCHVLFESAVRGLDDIRASMGFEGVGDSTGFTYAGRPIALVPNSDGLLTVEEFEELIDALGDGGRDDSSLTRGQIQGLKEASTEADDRATLHSRVDLVRARFELLGTKLADIIDEQLPRAAADGVAMESTMFISALDLAVVRAGTVAALAAAEG